MDYAAAIAYLNQHVNLEGARANRFGGGPNAAPTAVMPTAGDVDALSLEPMRALMSALGDPQDAYRTIHITGTNGKGSTARMTSSILQTMDLSVGLYTSPHLHRINERIRWDGRPIPDDDFATVVGLLQSVEPLLDHTPSFFELLTALALVWFAEQGAEVAVIEVGLLGRYDATNVINGDVAVITNIGKDHTDGSEGWEKKVAAEKAGIIKPTSHVVLGSEFGELRSIVEAEESAAIWAAGEDFELMENRLAVGGRSLEVRTPGQHYDYLFLPVHGGHQGENAATAIAAVEAFFDRPTPEELLTEAFAEIELPGRFEIVDREPTVVLDGAHNPHGAAAAYQTLNDEIARLGSWVLVVGMLAGKDPTEMLEALGAADFDAVICTQPDWSRAIPAEDIARAARNMGLSPEVVRDPAEAMARARAVTAADDLILVAGSLYLVGEVRSLFAAGA